MPLSIIICRTEGEVSAANLVPNPKGVIAHAKITGHGAHAPFWLYIGVHFHPIQTLGKLAKGIREKKEHC